MKNVSIIILIVLTSDISIAQTFKDTKGEIQDGKAIDVCEALQGNSFDTDSEADQALDRIINTVGLQKNFVLMPCEKINNAIAITLFGVRHILYDPAFMSSLTKNTSDWTKLFILAHEVGHHLNGHTLDAALYLKNDLEPPALKKRRRQELEADEFAAFVLARLGCDLNNLLQCVKMVRDGNDLYSTHPNKSKRRKAIERGFNRSLVKKISNNKTNNSTKKTNTDNYLYSYITFKVSSIDSVVNKFSHNGDLIKQEVYRKCNRLRYRKGNEYYPEPMADWKSRCKSDWLIKSEYEFYTKNWVRGMNLEKMPPFVVIVKEKKYSEAGENASLNSETTRYSMSDDYAFMYLKDSKELGHVNKINGEYIEYYENGAVMTYAFFIENRTRQFIHYWNTGEIKKIENTYYDGRLYDGKLDRFIHKNGTDMMEFGPLDLYFEGESGDILYDNGQLFCTYTVIPLETHKRLVSMAVEQNKKLTIHSSLRNYYGMGQLSRFHTGRMFYPSGQLFAILKFDEQVGSTFNQCFDTDGKPISCKKFSPEIREHIKNVLEYSSIRKITESQR